jgi:Transmembrane secretion effector
VTSPTPRARRSATGPTPAGTGPGPVNPTARVLALRDFRLLAGGTVTSLLGDQFSLIALPWLVLQLTHNPMALGATLALEGAPRAILMLVGGAVTDRASPRRVMQVTATVRGLLTALLAVTVATNAVQPWMVFVASALFGVVAGFSVPAENSIVPQLVASDDLQAGNSIIMGLGQLAGFVGPSAAGVVIGAFSHTLTGVAIALAIDAATFAVCLLALTRIRAAHHTDRHTAAEGTILAATLTGLRYLWCDATLRAVFVVLMIVNFLVMGPLLVGIPLLADGRLIEGSTAFGLLMSAFAGGNLIGYLAAGSLARPSAAVLRRIMIAFVAAFGAIVDSLALIPWLWLDFVLLAALGLGNGFIAVLLMSLMMLASSGLVPISQALAGALSSTSLTLLFMLPGSLVVLVAAALPFLTELRRLGTQLAAPSIDAGIGQPPVPSRWAKAVEDPPALHQP